MMSKQLVVAAAILAGTCSLARADGQARTLEPMNAYERRIVHLALQHEPGLTTHSVGEGHERRVRIEPSAEGGAGEAPPGGAATGGETGGC